MSAGMVLSLFDYSGNMVRPWADAGYECVIVDLQHGRAPNNGWDAIDAIPAVTRLGMDVADVVGAIEDGWSITGHDDWSIVFAFPPCTHLAISGARWFQEKGMAKLIEALTLVEQTRHLFEDIYSCPFMIENPVGTLSTYWRKPDYSFDPCDFGGYEGGENDGYTKRTHLWTGHGFRMPPRRPIPAVDGSRMHKLAPGSDRANQRSETPRGFARAVFEANQPGATPAPFVPEPDSLFAAAGRQVDEQ